MLHNALKLAIEIDHKLLFADLDKCLKHQFIDHFNQTDYQGSWTSIALRSPDGRTEYIFAFKGASSSFSDTPLLSQCRYFKSLIDSLKCEKHAARILNLKANSHIREHTDYMLAYEDGYFRLHIPIITNDGVSFYINDEKLHMQPGECWYANFSLPHRVVNEGDGDRIHLVIDCKRNEWTDSIFSQHNYDISAKPVESTIKDKETAMKVIIELEKINTPAALEQVNLLRSLHHIDMESMPAAR